MTLRVLLVRGELRGAALDPLGLEHRVVAEAVLADGGVEHPARPHPELDVLDRAVDERRGADELGAAIRDTLEVGEQQAVVVAIVAGAGVARRVDARCSAERVDPDAGVVGDRRQAR